MRYITIGIAVLVLSKTFLNFGPIAILDKLGLDIYTNAIMIGIVEIIGTLFMYSWIQDIPRKAASLVALALGGAICFALIFIEHDRN